MTLRLCLLGLLLLNGCAFSQIPVLRSEIIVQPIKTEVGLTLLPFRADHPDFLWWMSFNGQIEPLTHVHNFERLISSGFFDKELKKYPPRFFVQAPIPVLFLAQSLKENAFFGGEDIQGFSVNALNRRVSFLSLDPEVYKVQGLSIALHHEIFHLIDDASQYLAWQACATPQRVHPQEHPASQQIKNQLYPRPGFVSDYAATDFKEDRAEMFAWLMASPELAQVLKQYILTDTALACKYRLLLTYLQKRFPNFDASHLEQVASGLQKESLNNPGLKQLRIMKTRPAFPLLSPAFLPVSALPLPVTFAKYDRLISFESDLPYTDVSEALKTWVDLRQFRLTDHRLFSFPEVTLNWVSLNHLVLKGVPLKELPDTVGKLNNLHTLTLDLEGPLSEKLSDLPFFRLLDLNTGQKKHLPEGVSTLVFLPEIKLSGKGLESILPIKGARNLRTLTLNYLPSWKTPVEDLQQVLPALKALKTLSLSHRQLSTIQQKQLETILPPAVALILN